MNGLVCDVSIVFLVPTRRRGNAVPTRQRREASRDGTLVRPELVPTPARGNQKNGASRIGSHAGAWEPEKWCVPNWFPRRRVGTRKTNGILKKNNR